MTKALSDALEAQRERLLPCVHCGFCLPACPTYTRLGDENDSPRGRLHLMRSVVEGRMSPASDAFRTHIDRCLGCRACEPVCPSGVEYGTLLELARETVAEHHPPGLLTRTLLAVMAQPTVRGVFMWQSRLMRGSGLAGLMAKMTPNVGPFRGAKLGLAMLAASAPWRAPAVKRTGRAEGSLASRVPLGAASTVASPAASTASSATAGATTSPTTAAPNTAASRGRVGVLTGCVQQGLFARVNDATVRVLEANGYEVVAVPRQDCCGALHAHGGDLGRAKTLAQANIEAFDGVDLDWIAVNAAGCGAAMKEYGTLLENDPTWSGRASRFAARVRDVTELLAEVGPRTGAEVSCTIAYDHPCHLLHAQKVERAPLAVLAAVPGADVRVVERADECCGGAGIYGITHPELGGQIGRDKVAAVRACGADAVATANPGCMMQIGAGLLIEGAPERVLHPVELLDVSYRRAGFYN